MGMATAFNEQDAFQATLTLSDDFSKHLKAVEQDLLAALQSALAPYKAAFQVLDDTIKIAGDEPAVVALQRLVLRAGEHWGDGKTPAEIWASKSVTETIDDVLQRELAFRVPGLQKPIRPMSITQHAFMRAMLEGTTPLVLGLGPTGTGKTHLALAAGINQVESGQCRHLVIASPHLVEHGNIVSATALDGATHDSQFAALEDELNDLIGPDEIRRLQEARRLEVMPIDRMRGRTFRNAFIVIDEAQNMTVRETRMAVTRIGHASRIVLTGDLNHVETKDGGPSGLEHLTGLIEDSDIAAVFRFTQRQIVRNPIVAELEALYAANEQAGRPEQSHSRDTA